MHGVPKEVITSKMDLTFFINVSDKARESTLMMDSFNCLGIIFNSKLTFRSHLDYLPQKGSKFNRELSVATRLAWALYCYIKSVYLSNSYLPVTMCAITPPLRKNS